MALRRSCYLLTAPHRVGGYVRIIIRHLAFAVVAGLAVGCAEPSNQSQSRYAAMQQAVDAFELRLDECTSVHGYDPNNVGDLAPNQLAPTERAWADCAYDGLRSTVMLQTAQPRLYDAIIAEHRAMTDKVESGLMTRSDRRNRMLELRADLRQKEAARLASEGQPDRIHEGAMDAIRNASISATRF